MYDPKCEFTWQCSCGRVRAVTGNQLNAGMRYCSPNCTDRGSGKTGRILFQNNARNEMKLELKHLQAWQDLSGACLNAGRKQAGVWTVKAFGHCAIRGHFTEYLGQGESLHEALSELIEKMRPVLEQVVKKGLTT